MRSERSSPLSTSSTTSLVSAPEQHLTETETADKSLDLSGYPPLYILPTHLDTDELHALEERVLECQGRLTYDAHEARIFIGKVAHKRRAALELRSLGVLSAEATSEASDGPARKSRRLNGSVARASSQNSEIKESENNHGQRGGCFEVKDNEVVVVTKDWLEVSTSQGQPQEISRYLVYKGIKPAEEETKTNNLEPALHGSGSDILARARADLSASDQQPVKPFTSKSQSSSSKANKRSAPSTRIAKLSRRTTDEQDASDPTKELPELPEWAKRKSTYSCERSTPDNGPNEAFIKELKKIRLARTLILDEIGVRAYSTSIAAVAAYPYPITDSREILRLPGCSEKIAALWVEWSSKNGFIQSAHDAETDPDMRVLRLFYDIWSVGALTARNFYNRGWRSLDDIIEHGWDELNRTQQIGLKYFDEFQQLIPRAEVQRIATKIHEHAQRVREPTGVRSIIVGGYRRGKPESGDVDVIISHKDQSQTLNIVHDIVESLMEEGWITHELNISLQSSRRGQVMLPFRREGGGHGFDNLDKALVVWQDPNFDEDDAVDGKNPNVHRRVDIIIAPWSRIGCAVLGWSAGTTFERDLRRYAKNKKKWKFDSSGIRDRVTGKEVDLEAIGGPCETAEEAERKVFAGMGLEYREPWERCTG